MNLNLLSYVETFNSISQKKSVSRLYTLNEILQINAPKKPANTHFNEQGDKCTTEFFFLANKETDFFSRRKPFSQFQKI